MCKISEIFSEELCKKLNDIFIEDIIFPNMRYYDFKTGDKVCLKSSKTNIYIIIARKIEGNQEMYILLDDKGFVFKVPKYKITKFETPKFKVGNIIKSNIIKINHTGKILAIDVNPGNIYYKILFDDNEIVWAKEKYLL